MMQKIIFTILLTLSISTAGYTQKKPQKVSSKKEMQVQFNKNIELLGLVYFIGWLGDEIEAEREIKVVNGEQIHDKEWYAYGYGLYIKYKHHQSSKHLASIYNLAGDLGTDYFITLFLQLEDFPHATLPNDIEEQYYIQFSADRNVEEAKKNASALIDAMNGFYREVAFDTYWSEAEVYYAHALRQIKNKLPSDNFIPAMEEFYQNKFDEYILVPSLTIPTGMGFGSRIIGEGKTKIYNTFGPLSQQYFQNTTQPDLGFGDARRFRELSTHEFGHSFVNPVVEKMPQELIDNTRRLYAPIETTMVSQGYINWNYCLNEHFVRAGEVIIARNLGNIEGAQQLLAHYIKDKNFIYLPLILEELEQYNKVKKESFEDAVRRSLMKMKILSSKM